MELCYTDDIPSHPSNPQTNTLCNSSIMLSAAAAAAVAALLGVGAESFPPGELGGVL